MNRGIFPVAVVIVFCTGVFPCAAQSNSFESLDQFPYVFLESLSIKNTTQDQYLHKVTETIFKHSKSKELFSKADFEQVISQSEYDLKRRKVSGMLVYDKNFDALVTEEEIQEFYEGIKYPADMHISERQNKEWAKKQAAHNMRMDLNGDSEVSMSEMIFLSEQEKEKIRNMYGHLLSALEIDPDKNGVISRDEWQVLAKEVFSIADKNSDGSLDDEEVMGVLVYKNQRRLKDRLSSSQPASPE